MLRVLRTDIYRLFRSKAFYVYPIFVLVVLIINMIFAVNTSSDVVEIKSENQVEDARDGFVDGISDAETGTNKNSEVTKDTPIYLGMTTLLESLHDGLTVLFITIIFIIFCTCETRRGFIKNAAGCVKDRAYMVISKIMIGMIITVVYTLEFAAFTSLSGILTSIISGRPLMWKNIPDGEGMKVFIFFFICFMVDMAIVSILSLIHELSNSRALGIVVAFVLCTTLIEQMIEGVVYLLKTLFDILTDFNIGKYLLFENINGGYGNSAFYPETAGIMSLIYISVCIILAVWVFRRKDIK